jgi:hypothetical protein
MAKKVHKKSVKSTKYKDFHLHGNYTANEVLFCIIVDLIIGFVLGYMLQPTIAATITSYAAGL